MLGGNDDHDQNKGEGLAPPPPPPPGPPPPLSGAGPQKVQLTPQQETELNLLREHVRRLQESDQAEAKEELKRLSKEHADRYSKAQRETVLPLESRLLAIKHEFDKQAAELDEQINAATKTHAAINKTMQQIAQQELAPNTNPSILAQIKRTKEGNPPFVKPFGERLQEALDRRNALRLRRMQLEQEFQNAERDLKQQRDAARKAILPLKAFADAVPQIKAKKEVAEVQRPQREAINIKAWVDSGLILGMYIENLRRFILKEDQVAEMDEALSDQYIFQKYNEFAKNPAFDERIIIAIATGYLYKEGFHNNDLKPLEGAKTAPEFIEIYEELLAQLYQQNPLLQQTAAQPLEEHGQIPQIMQYVEEQTAKSNVAPRSVLPPQPKDKSPAPSSQTVVLRKTETKQHPTQEAAPKPAMRPAFEAIEQRREQLEQEAQQASRAYVNPLSRVKKDTEQVLELHKRITEEGNVGIIEAVALRDLNEQMERGNLSEEAVGAFRALSEKLHHLNQSGIISTPRIRDDLDYEKLIRTSTAAFSEMESKVKAETPVSILQHERSKGFMRAVNLWKSTHQGKAPPVTEMNAWLKAAHIEGQELRTLQQQMKNVKDDKPQQHLKK